MKERASRESGREGVSEGTKCLRYREALCKAVLTDAGVTLSACKRPEARKRGARRAH